MSIAIDDVIKRIADLPSLSAVVVELLASMEQEDIDVNALGAKIALDQALTAKTLRLANSSFYGMSSTVTSIPQAISVLGFHSIRTIVTACAVTGTFPPTSTGSFNFKAFWRHSVGTAVAAKILARHLKTNPDAAFTAGLLHDIGALVLATRFPGQYEEMLAWRAAQDCYVIEAERAVFGIDHTLAGKALAAYWKFPPAMQNAVADHHRHDNPDATPLSLAVHAANTLAHGLDLSEVEDDLAPPMSHRTWKALGLDEAAWMRLLGETEATYKEMCQILVN
ncbi:MAG: HDOD domain-containing protein [Pseudomonadota bacterium]